jgi:soluble lytic murein transglycosylase
MPHRPRSTTVRLVSVGAGVALAAAVWLAGPAGPSDGVLQAQATSDLWIVPEAGAPGAQSPLARALARLADGQADATRAAFGSLADDPMLGGYALLYKGRAELAAKAPAAAMATALGLIATDPRGHLGEAAGWLAADAAEATLDWTTVARVLDALTHDPHLQRPATAWLRLGVASAKLGRRDNAVAAFERVRYEYPLSAEAPAASAELNQLLGRNRAVSRDRYTQEFERAKRLFGAGRYSDALSAFEGVRALSSGDDRDLIELRLAECEFHLGRASAAKTAINAYVHDRAASARVPEARFYFLSAQRALRQHADYIERVDDFVKMYPDSPFAQQALDELGTHYIVNDEDAKAAAVFADLYRKYPTGPYSDRAAWKSGWWAYKQGKHAEAAATFESAFERFDRSDYRPSWLYWAARSRQHLGQRDVASEGFRRVVAFYRNSYYGREAARELPNVLPASRELPPAIDPGGVPENGDFIRRMLAHGLYDDAILELRRVQRASGSSPAIEATISFALAGKGDLRPSINAMRRAYPQFMAAGGEALPIEIRRMIFPVDHRELIVLHSTAKGLDPYLVTALVAQESTFQADVRSAANAWGLMQILPSTGQRIARTLGIQPFGTARLTEPDVNVRIGTEYFSTLMAEFNDPAPSLASYNAGESRVRRWLRERPGMARDEFIDDIPFPETQNYVKRVIGTAEDYRQLYPNLSEAVAPASRTGR